VEGLFGSEIMNKMMSIKTIAGVVVSIVIGMEFGGFVGLLRNVVLYIYAELVIRWHGMGQNLLLYLK
jgi:hypothetical protein